MKHLKVLNSYFIKYKWHFLGGLLFVSLSTIFGTYQGVIVRNGTNRILEVLKQQDNQDSFIFIQYGLTIVGTGSDKWLVYVFDAANHYCYEPAY